MDTARVQEKRWLVVYTRSRWEKKVHNLLIQQGIESYCPLKQVQNQWSDRKKDVSIPLFTSYVFVRVNAQEQTPVLYTQGVYGYVNYMSKPAVVRDSVIEEIKENLITYKNVEIVDLQSLAVGDRVRVKQGVFNNQIGEILRVQNKTLLMVFEDMNCAMVTRIPLQYVTVSNLTY
jgi:transcriptional antiterminator RfaH